MTIRRKRSAGENRVAKPVRRRARKPRSRPGGRSARVRAAVLQAAFSLLTEKGLEAFSLADVAARAGVHETSIYRRWGTKNALAREASLHFAKTTFPIPDTGSLRSDLVTLIKSMVGIIESPQGQTLLAMGLSQHPHVVAARQELWRWRREALRPMFDRAISRGDISPAVDLALFLEALIAPIYLRRLVTGEPLKDWRYEELVDRLLAAYRPQAQW